MAKLVTLIGGSGFVGRYIARAMAKQGWRIRVAVRRPNEALFVKPYGVVGQVEPMLCNIRDDASIRAALMGADAVVNCVGVLLENGKNTFEAVQREGGERVARLATEIGVLNFVHLSALGANAFSNSLYSQTKAEGEQAIFQHFPKAVILRPSIIFGAEDGFFNRFAAMSQYGPILPIVGAETRFQPVFVEDVARAAVLGILGRAEAGIYELGGPEICSFRALMEKMLQIIERRRLVLNVPFFVARLIAFGFDMVQLTTGGLVKNGMITRDQVKNLGVDNIVNPEAQTFADLEIEPIAMAAVLPDYLWRFRVSGQYAAIKSSADNLNSN